MTDNDNFKGDTHMHPYPVLFEEIRLLLTEADQYDTDELTEEILYVVGQFFDLYNEE